MYKIGVSFTSDYKEEMDSGEKNTLDEYILFVALVKKKYTKKMM